MSKTRRKNAKGDFSKHDEHRNKKQQREGKPRDEKRALRDTIREYQ